MWWDQLWSFLIDKHIFHALLFAAIIYVIIFPGRIKQVFGRFKKVKAGPFELEAEEDDINPETPCPYTKSRDTAFGEIRNVKNKVDHLEEEVHKIFTMVQNMAIDQQKQHFYDQNQPAAERLAGGLKYIFLGGNGHSKKDVIAFAEEHKDIYNALTSVKPDLRIRV